MENELNNVGLIGDPSMSSRKFGEKFVEAGKIDARNGACSELTPAMRGHLRAILNGISQ